MEFPSEGATLRGVLITPDKRTGPCPVVVMAHGTSATIQMVAIEYARAFARAGIAALIYDHRNFGRSTPSSPPSLEAMQQIRSTLRAGNVQGTPETTTGPMPVVSPSQLAYRSLLAPIQAFRWFTDYGVTRQAYDLIPTEKHWHDIRDGHFGLLYHPGERFSEAAEVQARYLRATLEA